MFMNYLFVALTLFAIGFLGVLLRRNLIVVLLCIELMLNAVALVFVASAHFLAAAAGKLYVFFILAISAAEVAVGLALVIAVYKKLETVNLDDFSELKW